MVLATAGTTVSIPESAKTALSSAFVRSMDATNVIKVKLANNYDRSGAEDMISFMPDGNNGFDDADLPFLPSPFEKSSSLKLFSTDGHALMGASVNAYAESHEIPVAVTGPMPGMYTLSFSGISNISNYNCIYLEDKQSGKVFNLKRGDAYSFAIQDPGVEYKFVLHLENEKASANGSLACRFEVDQTGHLSDAVNMFSNENGFSIDFGFSTSTPVTIEVYNSIGELVIAPARREVTDELISIGADLPSGLYIVRVTANGELINRKLFHL
jgi:hypothetical protein